MLPASPRPQSPLYWAQLVHEPIALDVTTRLDGFTVSDVLSARPPSITDPKSKQSLGYYRRFVRPEGDRDVLD